MGDFSLSTSGRTSLWRGKRIDPTGYYWFGANVYDPLSGRWLSPDSVGHEGNLSLYTYCSGDPINSIDPDGRLGKGAWEGLNDQIDRMTGIRSDWDVNLHQMQGSTAFRIGYQVGENAPDIAMNVAMLVLPEVLPALAGAGTVSRVGRTFSLAVKEIEAAEVGAQTALNLERAAVSPLEAALQGEASLLPKIGSVAASTTTREQGLVFNPKAHYNFETFNEGITGAPPLGEGGTEAVLKAGQAGKFSALEKRAVVGDGLTPHHMPQTALGFTSRADGGAIVMPQSEHVLTRTYGFGGAQLATSEADVPFRTVLARDIRDLRRISGNKYNQGAREVIDYYNNNFPGLILKQK